MQTRSRAGYIIPLVLMLLSLLASGAAYLVIRSTTYTPLAARMPDIMASRLLATSGIQLGMAQLVGFATHKKEKEGTQQPPKKTDPYDQKRNFLQKLLPQLNRLQEFRLKKSVDGVNGSISIALGSEGGKININELWDFKKKEFVFNDSPQIKAVYEQLFGKIGSLIKQNDLLEALRSYFTTRGYFIDDPTQLITVKEFQAFAKNLFYMPDINKDTIALTDIFTVWSAKNNIDPLLFSHSLKKILDLNENEVKNEAELVKKLNEKMNWKTDWDKVLQPLYEKNFNSLPKSIDSILTTQCEPKMFTILSYGKVGKVTSRMLAYVELITGSGKDATIDIKIRKLYWL